MSPQLTKAQRKMKDKQDSLAGNLFAKEGVHFDNCVYQSLLETLVLYPKKKHLRKVCDHLARYGNPNTTSPKVISLINFICTQNQLPVVLGTTFKQLIQNKFSIDRNTFKDFLQYLDKCKGFEDDSKRFVVLAAESRTIQVDYNIVRPFFLNIFESKKGQEVLKLFEQVRKNLKSPSSKGKDTLKDVRKDFYDGLIADLIEVKAFELAQIIFSEK